MKKVVFLFIVMLFSVGVNAQIYEGFTQGMTKEEAKSEFRANKDKYKIVDLGNGWVWRLYHQNFKYNDEGELIAVKFTPKGGALGVGYDNSVGYLEQSKLFFDKLGYETILEQDYWNAPLNFQGTYGLLMSDPEKKRVIQLFPSHYENVHIPQMNVWDYDAFMSLYEGKKEGLAEKAEATGF